MCTTSRRNFLAATSAAGLGAVGLGEIAPVRLFAQKRPATGRIDVHHHLCPPLYAQEASKSVSLFPALADWTPQRSVEDKIGRAHV